jgi:hypothetical protein
VHTHARSVLGNDLGVSKVDFIGHTFDQRFRAWHNGGDLKWPLQEPLEEKDAHSKLE